MAQALYIHWPFCLKKCPYCDFNSHVREGVDVARWQAALLADMRHEAQAAGGEPLESVFFGGGTPSLMPPALVAALLGDETLRFLGRLHSAQEGVAALRTAQAAFDRVSFDLIYARPGQTAEQWRAELERALGFGTGHLSLYQLTIEANTRFATDVRRGAFEPLADDPAAELFELTRALT